MKPAIDLQIDELVLYGFPPGERYRIAEALQAELGHLLAERGTPPALTRGGAIDAVDGGSVMLSPGTTSHSTGRQVARSVYRGLNR